MKRAMLLLGSIACGPDLPIGWEGADRVSRLTQTECAGSPYEAHDERVEATFDDPLQVVYREAHFRCAQDVEAFAVDDGELLSLLVQPTRMNPKAVAGCDCLYDVTMELDLSPDRVVLWRRWDAINDPNDPVRIGEVAAP